MELLSPRTKSALDRLTELASGDRVRVLDALAQFERKQLPDMASVIRYIQEAKPNPDSQGTGRSTGLFKSPKQ